MVTIDAAGCQTAIVQNLRAAGADYVLAVKRNQATLHREVKAAFDEAARGPSDRKCRTTARPSSATAAAARGAPRPCWGAAGGAPARGAPVPCWGGPASASGWRTPRSGPAGAA